MLPVGKSLKLNTGVPKLTMNIIKDVCDFRIIKTQVIKLGEQLRKYCWYEKVEQQLKLK